jgi:NitT/TauT family transport system substrate-binding protein
MTRSLLRLATGLAITLAALVPVPASAAPEDNTITCAYPVWVGFGPVHLANDLGYFKEEGIEVKEILDDDFANAMAAMERGDVDCALRTVGEYQGLGRRKDTKGIIIGTIDLSIGGDGWAADGEVKSVCDLKGKSVAVEPNLPARLLMQMALKKECNLMLGTDVPLADIAAADAVGVFADKSVAAVGTYEPVLSQVVATHADRGAHVLVSSKAYDDLILDVVFVHNDHLKANPDKYVKLMRGIYRAIDYFYANQEAAIPIIAKHFSITPEDFKATLPNFRYTPFADSLKFIGDGSPGRAYEVFRETMELNLEFKASEEKLEPENHIDPSIMAKVKATWK